MAVQQATATRILSIMENTQGTTHCGPIERPSHCCHVLFEPPQQQLHTVSNGVLTSDQSPATVRQLRKLYTRFALRHNDVPHNDASDASSSARPPPHASRGEHLRHREHPKAHHAHVALSRLGSKVSYRLWAVRGYGYSQKKVVGIPGTVDKLKCSPKRNKWKFVG